MALVSHVMYFLGIVVSELGPKSRLLDICSGDERCFHISWILIKLLTHVWKKGWCSAYCRSMYSLRNGNPCWLHSGFRDQEHLTCSAGGALMYCEVMVACLPFRTNCSILKKLTLNGTLPFRIMACSAVLIFWVHSPASLLSQADWLPVCLAARKCWLYYWHSHSLGSLKLYGWLAWKITKYYNLTCLQKCMDEQWEEILLTCLASPLNMAYCLPTFLQNSWGSLGL